MDGSAPSEAALRWAYHTAALESRPVTALLAWTADGLPRHVFRQATRDDAGGLTAAATGVLNRSIARVPAPDPPVELRTLVVDADPVDALLQHGRQAAVIVLGAHGHGPLHRALVGSVSQRLVHHATVPVVVVRGTGFGEPTDRRPLVVGVDGSAASLAALRWAAEQASLRKVPLRLVHAYRLGGSPYAEVLERVYPALRRHAEQLLDAAVAAEMEGVVDVETTTEAVADTPARALLGESDTAQLVVVGARGHGGFGELLVGSTSHQCVLHAACPVAVIRA
jgi:nucleotide-binding universal stress UspA family protein